MAHRFGEFELDEKRRELRLRGEPVALQPRAFDLLALLVNNRDRVVGKEELLDTLWPGVIVGDSAVQRAVSLARAALKRGGMGEAIRNYARQGYRFCADGEGTAADEDPLAAARAAFSRGDWAAAAEAYGTADERHPLEAGDLEHLATAQQCMADTAGAVAALERAAAAFAAGGDCTGAARAALKLAEIHFERHQPAVVEGWLARAERYLRGIGQCWERGFEAYIRARVAVATGDLTGARDHAARAIDIGTGLNNGDIESLGRLFKGYAELALGNVADGTALVDEAAAAVLGGEVSPWVGGVIYCGLVWTCCNRGDWERAAQWTESFSRWCERRGMVRFSGLCQLHQVEVMSMVGDSPDLETQIERACHELAESAPFAEGDAFRILGELRLLRGDLEGADTAFRRAHELGWDPQPGLSMLQAAQGDAEAAIRGLRRALDDSNWTLRQRRGLLLAELAIIAARDGQADAAREAMAELDAHPELWTTDAHGTVVAGARAELAALDGDVPGAIAALREVVARWRTIRSGLNMAVTRLRLAELLALDGDVPAARLELDAAQACFEAADAPARIEQCCALRDALK